MVPRRVPACWSRDCYKECISFFLFFWTKKNWHNVLAHSEVGAEIEMDQGHIFLCWTMPPTPPPKKSCFLCFRNSHLFEEKIVLPAHFFCWDHLFYLECQLQSTSPHPGNRPLGSSLQFALLCFLLIITAFCGLADPSLGSATPWSAYFGRHSKSTRAHRRGRGGDKWPKVPAFSQVAGRPEGPFSGKFRTAATQALQGAPNPPSPLPVVIIPPDALSLILCGAVQRLCWTMPSAMPSPLACALYVSTSVLLLFCRSPFGHLLL